MTEATPKRRRARKPDGKFQGDNPATPGLNEAWEATDIAEALPKKPSYEVQQKVGSTSEPTAGKYSKKEKIRPRGTFGNVHTTYN